jgi:serine protease Do
MKIISSFPITTAGIAIMLAARAAAIEAPSDDAPPPPIAEAAHNAPVPANQEIKPEAKAETPYLGVVSSAIPEMLAVHLDLKAGEGVLVRGVMPDGPAAKAGIAVHDIITRVGGQAVGSPEDLSRQVKTHKPGETLHLDLIQKGKPVTVDVTLGIRPAEIAGIEPRPLDQLNLDGVPEDMANRVRDMIQGKLGGLDMHPGEDGALQPPPQLNEAMREMEQRMKKAMEGVDVPEIPAEERAEAHQGATIRMLDGQGSIELKSTDGSKEVTIRDKDNKITWTGPWDTEQDKAAAPEDVRQRMNRLNLDTKFQGNGLRLHMGPPGAHDDEGE